MVVGRVLYSGVGFVTRAVLAVLLAPAALGAYGVLVYAASMAGEVANLGTQNAHVHNLGRGRATPGEAVGYAVVHAVVGGALAVALAYAAYRAFFHDVYFEPFVGGEHILVVLAIATIPFRIMTLHLGAILMGLRRFWTFNLAMLFEAVLLLGLICAARLAGEVSLAAVLVAALLSTGLAAIAILATFVRGTSSIRFQPRQASAVLRFGASAFSVGFMFSLATYFDVLIVGWMLPPDDVGVYFLAATFSLMAMQLSSLVAQVLYPFNAATGTERARRTTNTIFRSMLWAGIAVTTIGTPFVLWLVPAVFGEAYAQTGALLALLLPGALALSLTRILYTFHLGSGDPSRGAGSYALIFLSVAVLDLLLIPIWGVVGAAIGMSAAYAIGLLHIGWGYRASTGTRGRELLILRPADLRTLARAVRGRTTDGGKGT